MSPSYEAARARFPCVKVAIGGAHGMFVAKCVSETHWVEQGRVLILSMTELKLRYVHLRVRNEQNQRVSFLNRWLLDPPTYTGMDIFPNPVMCPSHLFNLWMPFAMDADRALYQRDDPGRDRLLEFLGSLCGYNAEDEAYLLNWIEETIRPYQPTLVLNSYLRVLITTNHEGLLGAQGRRLHVIRGSDQHVGDHAYFAQLAAVIEDRDALHTFWDHFKPWTRLRRKMRVRAIVLYWHDLTKHLMAPGGTTEARDLAEHEAMWE